MTRIDITLKDGKWLINGKRYQELADDEKRFFDEFLTSIRSESTSQKS